MLTAGYFDASGTHAQAQDLCLAGYLFRPNAAVAFDQEWREMLERHRLPYFHMKECAHATGVFASLGRDGCATAAFEAIQIIKKHAAQGIAFSLDKSVAAALCEGSPWENEYSFLVGQVFFALRDWADRDALKDPIACLFESGDDGQGQAVLAAKKILNTDIKDRCRISTFDWADKNEETPLQAADMLAWHMNKWRTNRRAGIYMRRKDFASLVEIPMSYHHYDGDAVENLQLIRANWDAIAPLAAR